MFQFRALRAFLAKEDGAVTVDWVVITAGIVGLCLAMVGLFSAAFEPGAQNLGSELQQFTIDTTF